MAPGAFGSERLTIAKSLATAATTMGIDPKSFGIDLNKQTFRLGTAMAASTNGAREAGFILDKSVKATGGIDNTPQGFNHIMNSYDAMNRYVQDKAKFVSDFYQKNGNTMGASDLFQKLNPPQRYINQALAADKAYAGKAAQQQAAPVPGVVPAGLNVLKAATSTPPAASAPSAPPQRGGGRNMGASGQAAAPIALPSGVPAGSIFSPSRNLFRAPSGQMFNANGSPA